MQPTLKERMEEVWRTDGCLCPNHLVRWNMSGVGYQKFRSLNLFYTKGTSRKPKGKKSKGKGYSWLSKFYQLAWRYHHSQEQSNEFPISKEEPANVAAQ
jgi:hypothetical protein